MIIEIILFYTIISIFGTKFCTNMWTMRTCLWLNLSGMAVFYGLLHILLFSSQDVFQSSYKFSFPLPVPKSKHSML